MAEQKTFLLRVDARVLDALRQWAEDDLRSLNGQIEYVLRQALRDHGRLVIPARKPVEVDGPEGPENDGRSEN